MTSKIKTHYFTIEISIFRTAVLVMVSKDAEQMLADFPRIYKRYHVKKEAMKEDFKIFRQIIEEDGLSALGQTIKLPNESGDVLILFHEDTIADVTEEVIVHETHHATTFLCKERGVDDEETEAYMQEYMFNMIINEIDNWNRKHPKKKKK